MTRATNFGIKRTHLQAGFAQEDGHIPEPADQRSGDVDEVEGDGSYDTVAPPPKKKRKRTPKSKRDGYAAQKAAEAAKLNGDLVATSTANPERSHADGSQTEGEVKPTTLSKSAKKKQRELVRKQKILNATEARRIKRIEEKDAATTCFACREKGHAARDCPTTKNSVTNDGKATKVVGICYRCGSTKHSLSRCKKPANPQDPFPYASCFVCSGTGHLASACPQNKAKGVYPNGGCCKLCGDTSHLAKDCAVRQKVSDPTTIFGTGTEVGPDEDDFHLFKRKTAEVDRDEKQEAKLKELLDVRAGAHSGVVKAHGNVKRPPKKVVVFK
ncbi:hypothetical protein GALMADRAFT_258256 [Galerina marginata CBS 339.88]|uniref:CCHC-type domain-containing protein n=1 Tax=Galerina marginata (strain CBS 339.88) TaxID=685588 RepID=A0A067SC70_GALM3|nr:hypothetical protein GALMADRAFT_258256 [Galerina marginata CBS 339.88]